MQNNQKISTRTMVQLAIFTAIMAVMSFTPLGYLKLGLLELSLMTIPVVVGAMMMGSKAGAYFGFVFGFTSFLQCFGMSWFGTTLMGINPLLTAVVCIVPRTLMGWCAGLLFEGVSRIKGKQLWCYGVGSLAGAVLNTVFFMSALMLLFGGSDFLTEMQGDLNLFQFLVGFVGIQGVVEAVLCFFVGTAISTGLAVVLKKSR